MKASLFPCNETWVELTEGCLSSTNIQNLLTSLLSSNRYNPLISSLPSLYYSNSTFYRPAYVVRGKVMFWHVSVCLFTGGVSQGGGQPGGVRSGRGGSARGGQVWLGGVRSGWGGQPGGGQVGGEGGQPRYDNSRSYCYAAGGMPLAFTQEDFLVITNIYLRGKDLFRVTMRKLNVNLHRMSLGQ